MLPRRLLVCWILLSCASAPVGAQVFTHPPADPTLIGGVEPRGGVNGSSHILAVDHMYVLYANPFNGGADELTVQAMAPGQVVMVLREFPAAIPDPDYEIYIRHSEHVTVQYDHLHSLDPALLAHLDSVPGAWIPLAGGELELMLLGQLGAPAPFDLAAGDAVGTTKSYAESWDIGVIDRRQRGGRFARRGLRRYPSLLQLLEVLGVVPEMPPFPGHPTLNSACFLRYMTPPLRAEWFALVVSNPAFCGRAGWDLRGRLRGHWFNPAIDTADPVPVFETERAALSVLPDHLAPDDQITIAIGTGSPFSGIDPAGAIPQLDQEFRVVHDPAPGAKINPDPRRVRSRTGTVCYDLYSEPGGVPTYNMLFLRLRGGNRLLAKFDATARTFPSCAGLFVEDQAPWDTVYVR